MKGFGWFLNEVEKIYVPGIVEYYGNMPHDPWQENLDRMESEVIGAGNRIEAIERATEKGFRVATNLVTHYKTHGEPSKQISILDAMYIADPDKVEAEQNSMRGTCWKCETKENLTYETNQNGKVLVVCESHRT
jgi:hypothetical protein